MNFRIISRNVGFALLVSALFMFLSVLVSLANGHDSALAALSISFAITFTIGIFPFIFVRKNPEISMTDGYMIIFLSWMLSFICGMLPYLLWGGPFTAVNAWFESVSGFTTTGGTILDSVEDLPKSLLFWRSSTHFIGGLGVVVFLLLMIPQSSAMRLRLANMELSSLSKENYATRANKIVYIFAYVYLAMNVVAFFAYWAAGMTPFDAINHSMSVCSTGGFSTKNTSIAAFDSLPITFITMFFMLVSSLNFGMLFMVFATMSLRPLNNPIFRFYIAYLFFATLICAIGLCAGGVSNNWADAALQSSFHVISYASTTGFAISDNLNWPLMANVMLLVAGVVCGMAGSTTGGVKADRLLIMLKAIKKVVVKSISPNVVYEVKIGKKQLRDDDVYPHVLYIGVFMMMFLVSVVLCLIFGAHPDNAFAGPISCLANVGPNIGKASNFGSYNFECAMVKIVYTIDMFMGRIEIYPILAVIHTIFRRRRQF